MTQTITFADEDDLEEMRNIIRSITSELEALRDRIDRLEINQ